ncbi:MAG: hypothetical protein ACK4FV_06335 [Candidatus Nitrosocaldus sp.]
MGKIIYYASAATIGVAGIIHLVMMPIVWERFLPAAILFLAAGIAQLFWTIPSIKRWSNYWLYIGIGGNVALIVLWAITRFPNPVTERALPINEFGIVTQVMQGAYIGVVSYILNIIRKERQERKKVSDKEKSMNRGSPIQ